jgi:hypothetical protein
MGSNYPSIDFKSAARSSKNMDIKDLERVLDHKFKCKPLLVGGSAMKYYGFPGDQDDIDIVVSIDDMDKLWEKHPLHRKDLWGDRAIFKDGYEVWESITLYDFIHLSQDAIVLEDRLIISLEKLLFLMALKVKEPKYWGDIHRLVDRITGIQYMKQKETVYAK